MRQLPGVRALADAKPEQVLKLWEGLGYYTRARNLQKAAQQIVAEHHGRFPQRFDDILALPGIGRYTAGAIASIAFNQPRPILDGNVIRLLTRLFGIDDDPREKRANQRLWRLAEALVEGAAGAAIPLAGLTDRPFRLSGLNSLLNQSLMELGALVCTPRQPRCEACPVRRSCVARREQRTAVLPNLGPRAPATARRFVAFVLKRRDRYLIRRRPAGVVNAHLWEFPNLEITGTRISFADAAREALGTTTPVLTPLTTIRHSITRYRISLEAFCAETRAEAGAPGDWLTRGEMEALAFTSAHRRILELIPGGRTAAAEVRRRTFTKASSHRLLPSAATLA
jgi:A/G-specific adenine glycosylase